MLTKQEMENIWNYERVDFLKNLVKKKKNHVKYRVTFKPYERVYHDPIEVEVWAKDRAHAVDEAMMEGDIYDTLREKFGADKWYAYDTKVEQVR